MSSSEEKDARSASSSPLQSAQQPADQLYAENEALSSASDYLSDAPSKSETSLQQPSQRESSAGGDPGANQSAAEHEDQNFVDEDSQDSVSSPSRPNKFRGPPSTWRNWTAPERDLAVSLDQLQAKDLSVHLYNSFKLGQSNRTWAPGRRAQVPRDPGEAHVKSKWIPPKVWTAWPLPPSIVPRETDERRWEDDAYQSEQHHAKPERPGQHLQEMLVAQVLRIAKERFRNRQCREEQHSVASIMPQSQKTQGRRRESHGGTVAEGKNEASDQKAVVMADDQRASEILQPTVQHMMTKLDDLLMGLHRARSAYLSFEDSDSQSQSQTSGRSTSRRRPRKRKREAAKPTEDTEASHDTSDHSNSDSDENHHRRKGSGPKSRTQHARSSSRRSRSQNFRSRKRRLGLRDWSDVLGIASLTGWPQSAVGSASARCAALFGEGISFRTLEEGRSIHEEHVYLPDISPPVSVQNSQSNTWRGREGSSKRFEGGMFGGVHVDGFLKPIEGKKSWTYTNKQSKRRQTSRKEEMK